MSEDAMRAEDFLRVYEGVVQDRDQLQREVAGLRQSLHEAEALLDACFRRATAATANDYPATRTRRFSAYFTLDAAALGRGPLDQFTLGASIARYLAYTILAQLAGPQEHSMKARRGAFQGDPSALPVMKSGEEG